MIKPAIVLFMLGWLIGIVWFDYGWQVALAVSCMGWPINTTRR